MILPPLTPRVARSEGHDILATIQRAANAEIPPTVLYATMCTTYERCGFAPGALAVLLVHARYWIIATYGEDVEAVS